MQKIKLEKIELAEINCLKNELNIFYTFKENMLTHIRDNELLFNEMLIVDVARDLYFQFGNKLVNNFRNHGKGIANITLSVKDAVILLACCSFNNSLRNEFENYVTGKFIRLLDQKLKNII